MKRLLFYGLLMGMLLWIAGCADYGSVDYSGDILLRSNPAHEEALKKIGEFPYSGRVGLDDSRFFAANPVLSDYLEFLLEDLSCFTSGLSGGTQKLMIGGQQYTLHVFLQEKGRIAAELRNQQGVSEFLRGEDGRVSGDPWWQSYDMADTRWTERRMSRSGSVVYRWEPENQKVFLIKAAYDFEALCRRRFDNTQDGEVVNASDSFIDLNLKMSMYLGGAIYLSGEKIFRDRKNKKVTVTAAVIDRDFDGRFTPDDGVDVRLSEFLGFSTHLPCGKPVVLNSRIKDRYILTLIPPPDNNGPFILNIKRAG